MTCHEAQAAIHAEAWSDELRAHVAGCPLCSAEAAAVSALGDQVRNAARVEAPEALRYRVLASLPAGGRRFRLDLAAAFAVGAAAMLLLVLLLRPPSPGRALADDLLAAHLQALASGRLVQVVSSDRHTVKPWFNGRVDTAPAPVQLADQGFPLLGGRVDVIRGKATAVLVYGRRLHRIDVFVLPASPNSRDWEADRTGHHFVAWTSRGLEYVAVSDVDPPDLREFARLMRG